MDTLTACTEGGNCASPEAQQAAYMETMMATDPPLEPVAPELVLLGTYEAGSLAVVAIRASFAKALVKEGFQGLTASEIAAINKGFGGTTTLTGDVETVLANMAYREGFYEKAAVAIRDIAGRHLFNDGNKRTAQAVVEQLAARNGVSLGSNQLRAVVNQVARGEMRSIDDISRALSGN